VPTFCRHGRVLENCAICSKAARTRPGTVADREAARRAATADRPMRDHGPARPASVKAKRRAQRPGSEMTVRRVARAADDGYANVLVPGLRATDDARRLADELVLATARLDVLAADPPGLYAEAAAAPDREEGLWVAFLIALLSPQAGDEPFAAIEAVRVPWATGELPEVPADAVGPRGAEPRRIAETIAAYRARAQKAGSQAAMLAGDASWTPQRRFDRAFERLAFAGFGRTPRFDFLLTAGRLGLVDAEPWTLLLGDAMDPVTIAAKRIFGIGDPVLLGRRSVDLATECGVPIGALDLALFDWASPDERYAAGVDVEVDDEARARVASALGV
jgi:hypothetical protein